MSRPGRWQVATPSKAVGLKHGFRSGLEEKTSRQLVDAGLEAVAARYEGVSIPFTQPATDRKYTPDWPVTDSIFIETKGIFDVEDRKKHVWIKQQHPHLDIRFVFSRAATPLYKGSPTTYAMWCAKNGFKYADKRIPDAWIKEFKT